MRPSILALSLIVALPCTGCVVAAAAGATYGYIKYDRNEASQDFEASMPAVWSAAIKSLESRGYKVEPGVARTLEGTPDSAEASGEGYWLRVEEQPGGVVRVRVRIGTFESEENKRKAALILEDIGKGV